MRPFHLKAHGEQWQTPLYISLNVVVYLMCQFVNGQSLGKNESIHMLLIDTIYFHVCISMYTVNQCMFLFKCFHECMSVNDMIY